MDDVAPQGPAGRGGGRPSAQVSRLLHEQAGPQWPYLAFLWVFCVVVLLLLSRFLLTHGWPWFLVVLWASVLVVIEALRQRKRVSAVRHARTADPVLVTIIDLGPRRVTVEGAHGPVRVPVSGTGGLKVGQRIWAAPDPRPGRLVVLVRDTLRPGWLDLITPRGPAEPV